MNKLFIGLTFAGLATALACVNACVAGNLAIDGTGNLFAASSSSHSIFKFTPDGKKSTFARRIVSLMEFITRCAPAFPHQSATH